LGIRKLVVVLKFTNKSKLKAYLEILNRHAKNTIISIIGLADLSSGLGGPEIRIVTPITLPFK